MDPARAALRSLIAVEDRRGPTVVGRHARLELVFSEVRGATKLTHAYAEPPLRVGRTLADGDGAHVILASSSPGIFGGDAFDQRIVVERGARVKLTSQSALQVHPTADAGSARLRTTFEVADDGVLQCHWDPLIPFAASRLDQRIDIHVGKTGRVLWSDAFMAGREGRGERWQFASLRHELRITRSNTLEYFERYRITPGDDRVTARWTAGKCCYFGTAFASGWEVANGAAEHLNGELQEQAGLHAGADRLSPTLMLVRLASTSGPPFHQARERLRTIFWT